MANEFVKHVALFFRGCKQVYRKWEKSSQSYIPGGKPPVYFCGYPTKYTLANSKIFRSSPIRGSLIVLDLDPSDRIGILPAETPASSTLGGIADQRSFHN